jgi:hypothetical protein
MSTETVAKTSKRAGRRRLLSPAEEREVHHLYRELNWTASEVRVRFPQLTESAVRAVADRWQKENPGPTSEASPNPEAGADATASEQSTQPPRTEPEEA